LGDNSTSEIRSKSRKDRKLPENYKGRKGKRKEKKKKRRELEGLQTKW